MIFIPFTHFGLVLLFTLLVSRFPKNRDQALKQDEYIYRNYPDIWKKLHPWGKGSFNSLGSIYLMRLTTDDPELIQMQKTAKDETKWIISNFILVPLIWAISISTFVLTGQNS